MWFVHVTIPVILMVQGLTHGTRGRRATCGDGGWHLYEPGGVCVHSSVKRVNWSEATDLCRGLDKGELVKIETVEKMNFVQDLRPDPAQSFWIGLRDSDENGTFRYTNGTELGVPEAGEGFWSKNYTSGRGHCVVIDGHVEGFVTDECDAQHGYFCETSMEIEEAPKAPQNYCDVFRQSQAMSNSKIECVPDDWVRVEGGDEKHMNIFALMKTFDGGKRICEQFEGNLAKVRSQEVAEVIGGLKSYGINETGVFIGLVKSKNGNGWTWVDGTPLRDGDYQNWNRTSSSDEECVMVKGSTVQWFPVLCSSPGFSLCEGDANPFLREKNNTVTNVVAKIGNSLHFPFEAYVSPPEVKFELRKAGKNRTVPTGQYDIFVDPVNGSIYSKFTIYMDHVLDNYKGNYTLILDNCRKTKLTYSFSLKTIGAEIGSGEIGFFTLESIIYITLGVCCLAILVILVITSLYIQNYYNYL